MPSLPDTAVIIFLGLLLFGPKGLAQIARQLGKLMGEFRRASNEFRMQMEEELRISEQADRQKQIAAIEAAAPVPPVLSSTPLEEFTEDHPHLPPAGSNAIEEVAVAESLPIATSGELKIMPPATGLPAARSNSLAPLLNSVPHAEPQSQPEELAGERSPSTHEDQRPMRHTNLRAAPADQSLDAAAPLEHEESLHG